MEIKEVTLTSKGQLTLPKEIRDVLDVKSGSKLLVTTRNREIIMIPRPINVLNELEKIRKRVKFTERDLKAFKEDRKTWSKRDLFI